MRAKMHFVLAAALAAAGCSGGDAPAPAPSAPAAVARVVVSPDSTTVEPGKTIQLTARVEDASGNPVSDRTLDWISYDVGVATAFLAHDAARLITGETLYVDGGYHIID